MPPPPREPDAPSPLPLDYFRRPPRPRRLRAALLLKGTYYGAASVAFGLGGSYAVLREGDDPRFTLLAAVLAPLVFAAGLAGLIHATGMVQAGLRKGGAGVRGGDPPPAGRG